MLLLSLRSGKIQKPTSCRQFDSFTCVCLLTFQLLGNRQQQIPHDASQGWVEKYWHHEYSQVYYQTSQPMNTNQMKIMFAMYKKEKSIDPLRWIRCLPYMHHGSSVLHNHTANQSKYMTWQKKAEVNLYCQSSPKYLPSMSIFFKQIQPR